MRDAILETAVPRLHIVPSTMDLSGFELQISHERDRAYRLRDTLRRLNEPPLNGVHYSYVLVDCPPSLDLVTVNAMAAAIRSWCRCNASSSRSKVCRNSSGPSSR